MKPATSMTLGVCAVLAVWVAMNFSNKSPFHVPASEVEKALDATLQKVSNDEYLFENAHIRPGTVPAGKHVDYSHLLSRKLMGELAAEEKQMVSQECNDVYVEGESCGFDYDPILCTQDTNPTYVYQTTHADAHSAAIDYSWPLSAGHQEKAAAHYALVKEADGWKIDSVQCVFD